MRIYKNQNFASVYHESLTDLMNNPEYETKPRDLLIKENTNVAFVIEDPLSCLYSNKVRSSQIKYIAAELLWYFMGRNDVDFIQKYAKFWKTIQNEDATVNSAYGHLLFNKKNEHGHTQYQWAIQSLLKDKDSRQAILHFNLPEHQSFQNKDFVCTVYGIFQIRNNRLNLTISMRSNDVIWGLPTDIAFFALLQSQAVSHLKKTYPALKIGTYTHIANSFHVYEHHFNIVNEMISTEFIPQSIESVNLDLIEITGEPTLNFKELFSTYSTNNDFTDPLYQWITKNIK